ncbi:MAG: M56 family peptidase, partial [Bacteroidetes bacterium]|nr:M56 family peptidase [Bacteroidota bacterium]
MSTIPYIAQVSLYWLLLYACYWLLLRRHTFFAWNRAYLLGSLLGAFALPLVPYPEVAPPIPMVVYEMAALPTETVPIAETQSVTSLPPNAAP